MMESSWYRTQIKFFLWITLIDCKIFLHAFCTPEVIKMHFAIHLPLIICTASGPIDLRASRISFLEDVKGGAAAVMLYGWYGDSIMLIFFWSFLRIISSSISVAKWPAGDVVFLTLKFVFWHHTSDWNPFAKDQNP